MLTLLAGKYLLVLIGVVIEGPILMVSSGVLLRLGVFSLLPLFLVLVFGDILADVVWYFLGRFLAEPFLRGPGHWFGLTPELLAKGKALFARYHTKILLISKVTLGFGMAIGVLLAAGASRVPFRRYLLLNTLGELVLVSALLTVGYYFSQATEGLSASLRPVLIIAVIVLSALALYGFAAYAKKRIVKS